MKGIVIIVFGFRYADILAEKIQQKLTAVEKIVATRKVLKEKIENFKRDKVQIMPLVGKITEQSKTLQTEVRNIPKFISFIINFQIKYINLTFLTHID